MTYAAKHEAGIEGEEEAMGQQRQAGHEDEGRGCLSNRGRVLSVATVAENLKNKKENRDRQKEAGHVEDFIYVDCVPCFAGDPSKEMEFVA